MDWLKNKYHVASIFFLLLGIIAVMKNIMIGDYQGFFWFCDFVPFLFAAGFLMEDKHYVKGLVNIGLVAQFIFIACLILNFLGVRIIEFSGWSPIEIAVSVLLHVCSANIALLLTYKIKPTKKTLAYSAALMLLMFALTLMFTSPEKNINYTNNTGFLKLSIPCYTYLWPVLFFGLIILPTQYLQNFLYNRATRNQALK